MKSDETGLTKGAFVWDIPEQEYIPEYIPAGSRIAGMEIQVFRNENSSQTNAYSHYSNYSLFRIDPKRTHPESNLALTSLYSFSEFAT